ncbi:uncharacterized protein IL334_006745 [Kwoniella shivajii]|uniref:Uncharacterized protein n=1 Tax=Kwoniella shivajii TaxID=564305 RepID=A0ABZ1D8Y4_9TREE|nr:hypothetical protein IL334_006745 [Kwoniella shivajii]
MDSPWLANPEGMVRDHAEKLTNGNKDVGPDDNELWWIEKWGKDDDERKIIMEVIKSRIELDWPYNYKALLLLGKMPEGELSDLEEKLGKFADSPQTVTGAKHLKEVSKPLHEKAKAAKAKKEEEEMKKRQEAIMGMWGGLWANNGYTAPALQYGGYMGWPYPYAAPPGIAKAASMEWPGKPPEGWSPTSITALPQIYPFSRTGYYAIQPEPPKDAGKPPSPWSVYVGIGPKP